MVKTGMAKNKRSNIISKHRMKNKRKKSAIKNMVLTIIPIVIETPTNPFLYSPFAGLKKVLKKSGTESICKT